MDFDDHGANDWLAVDQFTVTESQSTRRPDIVLFLNGLPLGITELTPPTKTPLSGRRGSNSRHTRRNCRRSSPATDCSWYRRASRPLSERLPRIPPYGEHVENPWAICYQKAQPAGLHHD